MSFGSSKSAEFKNHAATDRRFAFIIGAQKSGTTWMYDYLGKHPQVMVPAIKELNYFWVKHSGSECSEIVRLAHRIQGQFGGKRSWSEKDRALASDTGHLLTCYAGQSAYSDIFGSAGPEHRILLDISPSYAMLDRQGFAEMNETGAGALFGFMMRDPIQRFWSSIRMLAKRRPGAVKKAGSVEKLFHAHLSNPASHLRVMSEYHRTIAELETVVPRDRICYAFYEDLFSERGDESLRDITDFLGIQPARGDLQKRVWVTDDGSSPRHELTEPMNFAARDTFAPVYDTLSEKFGDALPANWATDWAAQDACADGQR